MKAQDLKRARTLVDQLEALRLQNAEIESHRLKPRDLKVALIDGTFSMSIWPDKAILGAILAQFQRHLANEMRVREIELKNLGVEL